MPSLTLMDLEVRFPGLDRPALAIPSLRLDAGERVAVVGPSGCGKTTFLHIITGLERITRGTVTWDAIDLARLGETRRDHWRGRHVGLVMQDFHLFAGLSALDNVLLPQRLSHWRLPPETIAEARRLLDRVGIERPGQPVETMSRGQKQRVAVARALVARPGIVVADEPTASLDADAGAAVADLLLDLTAEVGATLIVASHDTPFVARLPRMLRLEAGALQPS